MFRKVYERRRALGIAGVATAVALSVAFLFVPTVAGVLALGSTWVWGLLLLLFANLEAVERATGRLLSLLAWTSSTIDRAAVASEVQGTINGARIKVADELRDTLALPATVRFVRHEGDVASLADGQVVIAMRQSRNHAENVARATIAYVAEAAIRPARPYVDARALKSIDFSLAKRLLTVGDTQALDYLIRHLWPAAVAEDPGLREMCHKVEVIQTEGLLTRVLLAEYAELGRRLYGQLAPPPGVRDATLQLIDLLYRLATKRRGEELGTDLNFRNGDIRLGIVLVGDKHKAKQLGNAPYIRVALDQVTSGCDTIYLLARGDRRDMALAIVEQLGQHPWFRKPEVMEYEVARNVGWVGVICGRLSVERDRVVIQRGTSRRSSWRRGHHAQRRSERGRVPVGPGTVEVPGLPTPIETNAHS